MRVEKSIDIAVAPEKIWPYLTDPAKIPLWFDTFRKCQYAGEQRSGVGTRYYVEEKVPGPLRKIYFEAAVWDENAVLNLRMTSGENVSSYEIHWKLAAHGTGTTFHFVENIGMPFGILGRLLGVLGQRTAEKMVETMLRRLKTLCEAP
ncbi:MAG TPA: SRPBCC family protein [Desulfobacteraceae bacterium]|nr:SRPBCC family protein [Desulfobacteraceae bacterium]